MTPGDHEMAGLRGIADGLWAIEMPHSMKGIDLGTRSTIAKLPSGGLFLCSAGPFEEARFRAIEALGEVEAIVAPNTFHHLYLNRAKKRFSEARVFLAPGLIEKVPGLPKGEVLGDEAPAAWRGTLDQKLIRGTTLNEVVFLHRPTRTLILTDMAFHIQRGGFFTRLFMNLNGGFGKFGPTRVLRSTFIDEAAVRASVESLLAWDFDRIIVAHGDIVETGGKEMLREAYRIGEFERTHPL